MAKRALVIRSGFAPPPGAHNDAALMGQVLAKRGFEVVHCADTAATRTGILAAYDALIEGASSDDALVIYYTGHGGLAVNDAFVPGAALPPYVQHVCPTDYGETRDDDFRGISALELASRLCRLSAIAPNTTVILECCFSSQMSRQVAGDAPVFPALTRVGLTRHLEEVRAEAAAVAAKLGGALDTSRAIRIVASGQTEQARRTSLPDDRALAALGLASARPDGWIGALTLALIQILHDVGRARVPWRSIASALQARLLVHRPEIEGPVARVPFSLDTVDPGAVAVHRDGDGARLDSGQLHGVAVGDAYRVQDAHGAALATLHLERVSAISARGRLVWLGGARALPDHAVAIAISHALDRAPVRIVAPPVAFEAAAHAVARSPRLRVADSPEPDPIGELRVAGDRLEVHDASGPLLTPAAFPAHLPRAVGLLDNLAAERWLRAIPAHGGIDPASVAVELGRTGADAVFRPIAAHGARMTLADTFELRLTNTSEQTRYVNVFDVGLQRRISLLSVAWTSGVLLEPHRARYVGEVTGGQLRAITLTWPEGLPRDRPRREAILALITDAPVDLRALETHGGRAASGLPERYAMVWRDFTLSPLGG